MIEAPIFEKINNQDYQAAPAQQVCQAETVPQTRNSRYLAAKRGLDIAASLVAILISVIPMLLIALLIRLESPGPAIFKQQRLGREGKPFTIYKFRTMRLSAPSEMAAQDFLNADRYVTRLGGFLRRSSIDELPQLLNILKGDMSFVGYRPVCLTETKLNDLRMAYGVFALRPGITGLAQVKGRDKLHYAQKAQLDAQYVTRCSLKLDIWCLIQTVRTVITGEGVN